MTTLNVGDRVHLKWDHSVTGAANYVLPLESWLNVSLDGGHITSTPASWWERIPDRTVGGREKFQRGDKVRAKHDPIFTGEVCEDFGNMVEIEAAKTTMRLPAKWLERIPEPLKENVPIEVLEEVYTAAYFRGSGMAPYFEQSTLGIMLRERGYGKADD